jgi:hypothetical protein
MIDEKKKEKLQNNLDTFLTPDNEIDSITDIYKFKRFLIMNIRTGEVRELDTNSYLIDQIVKTLLDSKLRIRETITDQQFIEISREKVARFKITQNTNKTDNNLDCEENDLDIDDICTENVILDF